MEREVMIKVLNRDNGQVIYSIPEMNGLRRVYEAGEVKEVTFEELQKLSYIPGGRELLEDSLVILNNNNAVKELLGEVQPEYSYTEEDVKKLLLQGSLAQFLDCLDFAPQGVKDLIKKLAVELPLNDVQKREAILEKTGFNVDNAIRILKEAEESEDVKTTEIRKRRVPKVSESEPSSDVVVPVVSRRVVKKTV